MKGCRHMLLTQGLSAFSSEVAGRQAEIEMTLQVWHHCS